MGDQDSRLWYCDILQRGSERGSEATVIMSVQLDDVTCGEVAAVLVKSSINNQ